MKKIIVATDFSDASFSAARYGLLLACYSKAEMVLLHVFSPPIPMAIEGTPVSPGQLYDIAEEDSDAKLSDLKDKLLHEAVTSFAQLDFLPSIAKASIIGEPGAAIRAFFASSKADLLLVGINPRETISLGFCRRILRQLIKRGGMPMLLVPLGWPCLPPRRIIFASDFSEDEIPAMSGVCAVAIIFNSDFILFHDELDVSEGKTELERKFLDRVTTCVNYPRMYYQKGKIGSLEQALQITEEEQEADMLVMVHRRHSVLDELIGSDSTLRMADRTRVPFLIFPDPFPSGQQKEKEIKLER